MSENAVLDKSVAFAERIVELGKYLNSKNEFVISNQIVRSGTSIGANVTESTRAQSRADFFSKLNIALKEADETLYWLKLLSAGEYIDERAYQSMKSDCEELVRLLVAITKNKD